jgi:outer membrane immunogenic protein
MTRLFVLSAASVIALAGAANAADMYRAPEATGGYKDGSYAAGPTWTGFYIGAHGGYAWGSADYPGTPAYPQGAPRPEFEGGFGGGQVGYNAQLDRFVVGAVADISFANLDKTVKDGNYLTETTKISQFGTLRAVAGYSFGRWLPYGTVGLAWADASYDMNCPAVADAPFGGCSKDGPRHTGDSQIMTGLAYGGGLKYAIDGKFSVGAEYLRLDLDTTGFHMGQLASWGANTKNISATADLVKFSVDYKLWGAGYEPLK